MFEALANDVIDIRFFLNLRWVRKRPYPPYINLRWARKRPYPPYINIIFKVGKKKTLSTRH